MKTVLFFSLFVIGNVFGLEGEFDGSPRIKARKVKDIKSAEMCADACQSKATCLIWKYNKKTKRCIVNLVKAKPNPKSTFGFPSSAPPPSTNPPVSCPEGWEGFEGYCYKLQSFPAPWADARINCTSYEGGDLASIHSEEEWDFVKGLIEAEQNGLDYWLGGKYEELESSWEWSDGSAWDFTKWWVSEPTGTGKYLETYHDQYGSGDLLWSATIYSFNYIPYVCKIQG